MVKNNVQHSAETDLHKAVVLSGVDIVATMVKNNQASITEIPSLLDRIVKSFSNSAAVSGIIVPEPVASIEPVKEQPARRRGRPAKVAREVALSEVALSADVPKSEEVAPKVEEVAPQVEAVNDQPVLRRGRGRPRKEVAPVAKPERYDAFDGDLTQEELDAAFRRRYPAKCTAEESLVDIGDGKMTCLIDGKRVSFLDTILKRNYGLTFEDYVRIYDLPAEYPSTPPQFKARKREDAKKIGLGTKKMREETGRAKTVEEPKTPVVMARASGRSRRTKVVDVKAAAAA